MNAVRELPARSRVARPWRNGGGVTRDIALFPAGASDDTFLWRASLATIEAAGPFSAWPDVDRSLMLLHGELAVTIGGAAERFLGPEDSSIDFAGETAVTARPVGGECTAFNIMARRGLVRARLERWNAARPTAADQLLLLADAATSIRLVGRSVSLDRHDALLLDHAAIVNLECDRPAIVVELFGATGPDWGARIRARWESLSDRSGR